MEQKRHKILRVYLERSERNLAIIQKIGSWMMKFFQTAP